MEREGEGEMGDGEIERWRDGETPIRSLSLSCPLSLFFSGWDLRSADAPKEFFPAWPVLKAAVSSGCFDHPCRSLAPHFHAKLTRLQEDDHALRR
jgi:hypothetical protein